MAFPDRLTARAQACLAAYGIEAAVVKGTIDHTPATYVIDPEGANRGSS